MEKLNWIIALISEGVVALAIGAPVNLLHSQSRAPSLLGPRASAPPSPMVNEALLVHVV